MRYRDWSYRFAEEILNSRLAQKQEVKEIIDTIDLDPNEMTRPNLNQAFKDSFTEKGWKTEQPVFAPEDEPAAKIDFMKNRVGVEVAFSHPSFMGIDLLKFQTLPYSYRNEIDVGIYIVTTRQFQKLMKNKYGPTWRGSMRFDKVKKYLPHLRYIIQVPIWLIGLESP